MRYILMFDKAVRVGTQIVLFVGPFETRIDAHHWYETTQQEVAVPLPAVTLHDMLEPF